MKAVAHPPPQLGRRRGQSGALSNLVDSQGNAQARLGAEDPHSTAFLSGVERCGTASRAAPGAGTPSILR
jgi:hypothetical protein